MTWERLASFGAWFVGLSAAVIASIPATDVPTDVRPALVLAGAVVIAVERYIAPKSVTSSKE